MSANTRELIRPNPSRKVQYVLAICFGILLFFVARVSLAQDVSFYEELNPTGNPIGGGVGYVDAVYEAQADYVVEDKAGLLSALGQAVDGQIIYITDDAVIDLTGEQEIVIPGGVTLASGRGQGDSSGALLYSDSMYDPAQLIAVLITGGEGVRITGLRMRGPSAEIGDHEYEASGVGNAIRSFHAGLEVDNCELWAWDKWAIWLFVSDEAYIHHNFIHHNRRSGYGYGVWAGGSGTEVGAVATIEANLFDFNRHSIGSSGHNNTWHARNNVQLEHSLNHDFDRHDNSDNEGGASTTAIQNLFLKEGINIMWDGVPFEEMRIENNWFVSKEALAIDVRDGVSGDDYFHSGNEFEFDPDSYLPVAEIVPDAVEGIAPLTVQVDGSSSYDPTGQSITAYLWQFNDTERSIPEWKAGDIVSYEYSRPGVYNVELMTFNENGVPGRNHKTIIVKPEYEGFFVSAWVKDTYWGDLEGHYRITLIVEGVAVWEDDVAENEGWQHIFVDISEHVLGKSDIELAFRVECVNPITDPESQIAELSVYVDDVYVIGGAISESDLESASDWAIRTAGLGSWSTGLRSEEARSGITAYQMRSSYGVQRESGDYIELAQTATLDNLDPVLPGDVSGNNTVDEDDVLDIIRHIVQLSSLQGVQFASADVSGNGAITIYDASLILKYIAGQISCFPVEASCSSL